MGEIKLDIPSNHELNFSQVHIDEESLLPNADGKQARANGYLGSLTLEPNQVIFALLSEQHNLNDLHLKSKGVELHYELINNSQTLIASKGIEGTPVFTAEVDNKGGYTFTLFDHIDRASPINLITNNIISAEEAQLNPFSHNLGWETHLEKNTTSLAQHITTIPHSPYQLTFYYQPIADKTPSLQAIQLYWNDQLIHTIDTLKAQPKGYTFSLEGSLATDLTQLKFIGLGNEESLDKYLHHISVISTAQNQLPLTFEYYMNGNGSSIHGQFAVNVTTTPPIELNNQEPFAVVFEQAVYQTIIVNDENPTNNPLTTINLETLFNNLSIPTEDRHVSIVQLQENGQATNVYEVQISDKNEELPPITVADVLLSFPGGEGGLAVFQRNISIEGTHNNDLSVPPILDNFT